MPRYVIEMDEPKTCGSCPLLAFGSIVEYCTIAKREDGQYGRLVESNPESEVTWPRPSWCPLRRLDDSSLEKHADATLTSVQHLINDSGPFPVEWDFETIRCHGCGETFIAFVAGRSRHCPRCGARLNVTYASEVKHPSYTLVSVDGERRAQELKEFRKKLGV